MYANNTQVVGHFTVADPEAAVAVTLGFTPRYVKAYAATTAATYEWYEGMASPSAVQRVTAGDLTVPTSNTITVSGSTVTFGTALFAAGEVVYYLILR